MVCQPGNSLPRAKVLQSLSWECSGLSESAVLACFGTGVFTQRSRGGGRDLCSCNGAHESGFDVKVRRGSGVRLTVLTIWMRACRKVHGFDFTSARSRLKAALIKPRWVKAWGKLPSAWPQWPICSAYSPTWLA